jgi:hypothetical protein
VKKRNQEREKSRKSRARKVAVAMRSSRIVVVGIRVLMDITAVIGCISV